MSIAAVPIAAEPSATKQYSIFSSQLRQNDRQGKEKDIPKDQSSSAAAKDSLYTTTMFSRMPGRTMSFSRSGLKLGSSPSTALRGSLRGSAQLRQAGMNLGISMGVYGGASLFKQTMAVLEGKQSAEGASAIVLSDILRSGMVGLGASAGGNLTDIAVQRLPIGTGIWTTVATVVGSALGASVGRSLMDSFDLRSTMMAWIADDAPQLQGLNQSQKA